VPRADLQVPPVLAALTVAVAVAAAAMELRRGEAVVPAYTVKVRAVPVVQPVPVVVAGQAAIAELRVLFLILVAPVDFTVEVQGVPMLVRPVVVVVVVP
jgi:hypothetical protein